MLQSDGSRAAAKSKMERLVIIVNGFQPLTIITKRSILDAAAVLDPPLTIRSWLLPYQYNWILTWKVKCLMFPQLQVASPEYVTLNAASQKVFREIDAS